MAIVEVTVSADITSYDTTNIAYKSIDADNPIENAFDGSSSSTYCRFYLVDGAQAETYIYFKFDFSSIPENATIKSVTAQARGAISSTGTAIATRQMQLATGTTLKGTSGALGTSPTTRTLDAGTWTRAELQDARVRYYAKRSNSNTTSSYNIRAFGATMTVVYEYNDSPCPIRVKQNGSWLTPTKVLVKDNGSWTEATKILAKDNGTWH